MDVLCAGAGKGIAAGKEEESGQDGRIESKGLENRRAERRRNTSIIHPSSCTSADLDVPPRSTRELSEEGYSGCEVRVTHAKTEIIIRATHTQDVLGEKGRRIRELTALIAKRFKFPENSLELYAEKVKNRGLSAVAQAESLRYKLLGGLAIRR